jgi:HEPN domain-containing protein
LLSLCALLTLSLGCDKMMAKFNLSRAQKRTDAAVANEAQIYTKDKLEQTQNKIQTATQQFNTQNYKSAAQSAKEAVALGDDLLQQTKIQRANALKTQAYYWIDKAKLNDANAIDANKFRQIQQDNDLGVQQLDKQKYDRAIVTLLKVREDLLFLLKNLETEAKGGLDEANQMKAELVKEGAQENAPQYVETLDNQIDSISDLITKEHNYRQAILVRDQARQTKQEGITETKKAKSQKMITEIENLLDVATQLDAKIYALQDYRADTKDFENILTQFYDKNYDSVLAQAPVLKPKVEDLILQTKRRGAQAKMEDVQTAINNLADGKARKYLPGSVEQLDVLLTQAKQLFDKSEFAESKQVSLRALDLEQKILGDFNNLATQQLGKAQQELSKADSVFGRMEKIFDKPIPGDWTDADKALEDSKQALKQELAATLANIKLSLGVAQLKSQNEKQYALAIEMAKQIADTSSYIQEQTYRVVAHNAVLEIANSLTRQERDGGRQYAGDEVDKTRVLLDQAKQLLNDGKYRDAVRRASDGKAQLEVVSQQLERVADEHVKQARQAIDDAKQHRAADFDNDAYQQSIVALDHATAALDGQALKDSIESSIRAENIAADSSNRALRGWTEEFMRQADDLIAKARMAGAERFAPEKLHKALGLRRNLQQLNDQAAYLPAVNTGRQAVDAAHDALYALIDEGENAVAVAKQYGAWDYEPARFTQAMVSLKFAREALENGDYKNAELHGYATITLANKLQIDAKTDGFNATMTSLEKRVMAAEEKGPGYFQLNDIVAILGEMNSLRDRFDPTGYEDYAKRAQQLDTRLSNLLAKTPDVLKALVIKMQDRMVALEANGARRESPSVFATIERKVDYAQQDFRAQKYRSSYLNASDAAKLIVKLELQAQERDFDGQLSDIFAAFGDELKKFDPVLRLGASGLIAVAMRTDGRVQSVSLLNATSPSVLRQSLAELDARARALKTPFTRKIQQQAAIDMFGVARTSVANFEKMLILDQYDARQARDIIQAAFQQLDKARQMEHEVMKHVNAPQGHGQPQGVQLVAASGN